MILENKAAKILNFNRLQKLHPSKICMYMVYIYIQLLRNSYIAIHQIARHLQSTNNKLCIAKIRKFASFLNLYITQVFMQFLIGSIFSDHPEFHKLLVHMEMILFNTYITHMHIYSYMLVSIYAHKLLTSFSAALTGSSIPSPVLAEVLK